MTDYRAAAREAAVRHTVPPGMFGLQIKRESADYDPSVISGERRSSAGALGIAQFMPETAKWLGVDPLDPIAALDAAAAYDRRLYEKFGSWKLALAAYNAGEGNVRTYGGVPPFSETRAYLDYILGPGWPEPSEAPVPTDRLTTTDDANFRAGPGTSKAIVQTLKKGSPVWPTGAATVTAEGHTWKQVALGPVGYIAEELLTGEAAKPDVPVNPRFNPDAPVITQDNDWDCAQQATLWALTAIGRHPDDNWMEADMLARGVESLAVGLTDATGAKLATWIRDQYGEFGIGAYNLSPVSFAQVSHLAGTTPVLIGGHGWGTAGHWAGVRRYRDDVLEIAQVGGHGPIYGQQTLDRAAWDARGPWSAVVITGGTA